MRYFFVGMLLMVLGGCFISYHAIGRTVAADAGDRGRTDTLVRDGFELLFIQQDGDFDAAVADRLKDVFFEVYPRLVAAFNPEAVRRVTLTIDTAYDGVAYAHNGRVVISQAWLEKMPGDVDVVTHEVMHIVQAYPSRSGPGWLVEGIADYVRHKYGVDNAGAGWSLPELKADHHYTQSYRVTARFLDWIENNRKPGLVNILDSAMRSRTYSDGIWEAQTGLTLDALWEAYVNSARRTANRPNDSLINYVRPLIGTAKMGHTFPGATVPFGAVQLSPDTDTIPYAVNGKYNPDVYKYCAGYQYDDPTIVGFSHTHFSGTGHSDLGDFLIMPTTGALQLNPGTADAPQTGFRSAYRHEDETAAANYYRVKLDDHQITAELTSTTRTGFHRYTFPANEEAHIILDLMHGIYDYDDKTVWTVVRVLNDSTVVGYRQTNGWARTRTVYFAMSFSKPFRSYGSRNFEATPVYRGFWRKFDQSDNFPDIAGKKLRMHFDFDVRAGEQIQVKFALSPVSMTNAVANMAAEIPHWDFERTKREGQALWEKELRRIEAKLPSEADYINFYTAMYHAALMPTVYMDVNGQYKGLDYEVHTADGFTNYTSFSLWDTFRAFHPYLNIVNPSRNADMVASMLAHYDQSVLGMLPIWSHYANDNWCMSGYHSVSVIADAIIKGVYRGDAHAALEACVATANQRRYEGIGEYIDHGYIPDEANGTSVSNTLEYAYDDWCIAQLAKHLGEEAVYDTFIKRSENWRNLYDASIGFMRPRHADGTFRKAFDVLETHGQGFIEGNTWNYSLYVPHNPAGLMEVMGGKARLSRYLDSLFTMHLPDRFFAQTEDITREGIIGNYVHGNEPAHHVAYLYNITGEPWKTQERVRMILGNQYHNGSDGLGGNDDCGQMSAWYLFSSLGFYPVSPGSDAYWLGSPLVQSATINLENGKTFTVEAINQSAENVYVKQVTLNGKPLRGYQLTHSDIVNGGRLVFTMGDKPNKQL